ncbi:VOC family protein [Variovorax sp. VNK109]|uniref:VOC family protein n=1 Tax=Variovorax sp. VNK109 TaxID=3400919 RepID=UPI003C03413D
MIVQPYLSFEGRCEEALEFYKKAIGARVTMLMRMKDMPDQPPPGTFPAGAEDKIAHSSFMIGDSEVMASDGMMNSQMEFKGVTLSIGCKDEAESKKFFNALADGGQVQMPLGKTFFSPSFGCVFDKFGVSWMVIVPSPEYGGPQ